MICKKCGSAVPLYTDTCPSCGTKVTSDKVSTTSEPVYSQKEIRKDLLSTIISYVLFIILTTLFAIDDGFSAHVFAWWLYCTFFWLMLVASIYNPRKNKWKVQILKFIALIAIMFVQAWEMRLLGGFYALSLFMENIFIIYNFNRNLTKAKSAAIALALSFIILTTLVILGKLYPINERPVQNQITKEYVDTVRDTPCYSGQDSIFVFTLMKEIGEGDAIITEDIHSKFQELYKRCPSALQKPDWSESYELTLLFFQDLLNSVKNHKPVISQKRALLGKEAFEEQNSYIQKAAKGDSIILPNGKSYYYTVESAEQELAVQKKAVELIQSKLDSLYDPNLYKKDSSTIKDVDWIDF